MRTSRIDFCSKDSSEPSWLIVYVKNQRAETFLASALANGLTIKTIAKSPGNQETQVLMLATNRDIARIHDVTNSVVAVEGAAIAHVN